jgi:hypothetical protein
MPFVRQRRLRGKLRCLAKAQRGIVARQICGHAHIESVGPKHLYRLLAQYAVLEHATVS